MRRGCRAVGPESRRKFSVSFFQIFNRFDANRNLRGEDRQPGVMWIKAGATGFAQSARDSQRR